MNVGTVRPVGGIDSSFRVGLTEAVLNGMDFGTDVVWPYGPLGFLAESGANVTPDKLKAPERKRLEAICDRALAEVVEALNPSVAIGVGQFAESALRRAVGERRPIARIPHPSPASPAANCGWQPLA